MYCCHGNLCEQPGCKFNTSKDGGETELLIPNLGGKAGMCPLGTWAWAYAGDIGACGVGNQTKQ